MNDKDKRLLKAIKDAKTKEERAWIMFGKKGVDGWMQRNNQNKRWEH